METILANQLESKFKENDIVVLNVFAEWCGPCKMLKPVLEQLNKDRHDVKFVRMDSDRPENRDLLRSLNVSSIPALFYYKNGELKGSNVGFLPAENILEKIDSLK